MKLRDYQQALFDLIWDQWQAGQRNVLAVAPCGAGKTVLFCAVLQSIGDALAVVIAHRQELIYQTSLALAAGGIVHSVIAPAAVVRYIIKLHNKVLGRSYYDPAATICAASIQTLVRRQHPRAEQVRYWVLDEAHHLLADNIWGEGVSMFPNAIGLGVTATPGRSDGKGLGRWNDGLFDTMVMGPTMGDLIAAGYLSDFKIFNPSPDIDVSHLRLGTTGDYTQNSVAAEYRRVRSQYVGGIVDHYLDLTPGQRGVTFVPSVEAAHDVANEFIARGVPAAVVSAKTPDKERRGVMERIRGGDLLQIVNVDVLGEGVDVPALSVCSMGRPTASLGLFYQQFGRTLRIDADRPGKVATIIDHVNNTVAHGGPPTVPRAWSLERRERRPRNETDPDVIPYRTCTECTQPYPATLKFCDRCGAEWLPAARSAPKFVEGDLVELDAEILAAMHGAVMQANEDPNAMFQRLIETGLPRSHAGRNVAAQRRRLRVQTILRRMLELYGSVQQSRGRDVSESQRRFWFRYGIDPLTAQALPRADAEKLASKIMYDLGRGIG